MSVAPMLGTVSPVLSKSNWNATHRRLTPLALAGPASQPCLILQWSAGCVSKPRIFCYCCTQCCDSSGFGKANIRPDLQPYLRFGRPDLPQIFSRMAELARSYGECKVAALVCGPSGMLRRWLRLASTDIGSSQDVKMSESGRTCIYTERLWAFLCADHAACNPIESMTYQHINFQGQCMQRVCTCH